MKQIITTLLIVCSFNCKGQTLYIDSANNLQYALVSTPFRVSFSDTFLTTRMYIQRLEGNGVADSTGFMDFFYLLMDDNRNQSMMNYVRLTKSDYMAFLTAFCEGNKGYVFSSVASKIGITLK